MRHDQAVQQVLKAREGLGRAELKEREAALALAQAEESRRLAAQVMAKEMGVAAAEGDTATASQDKPPLFEVVIDEEFFSKLDELECEQQEKEALR
eukprot:764700-Pyramimonas_sp.AAC.1